MHKLEIIALVICAGLAAFACGGSRGGDDDAGTDADSDTDADADADADSDSDADTDADADADTDTDTDTDADSDSDTDTDADSDSDSDTDTDADSDTDTDADADTDTDGDGDADADCSEGWCGVFAGSFFMGSPEDEYGRDNDEVLHEVTLTRSFLLKQTEVTQEEWFQSMGTDSSYFPGCGDSCPVENLNWYEAVAYCNALSLSKSLEACYKDPDDSTNYDIEDAIGFKEPSWPQGLDCEGYRLPTEAEWEYAARAGTVTAFYTGTVLAESTSCEADANLDPAAWYCANSEGTTQLVGQRLASDWGLHDMLGNVWEWVWDWYDAYNSGSADPLGPETGQWRVYRGGSYHHSSRGCRAALRGMAWPGTHDTNPLLGLRPARTIP